MAETTTAKPSFLDTLGNWVDKAGQIFNSASQLYVAADQRVKALESIDEDSGNKTAASAPQVVSGIQTLKLPEWVLPVAAALGVLLLIVIVRKSR